MSLAMCLHRSIFRASGTGVVLAMTLLQSGGCGDLIDSDPFDPEDSAEENDDGNEVTGAESTSGDSDPVDCQSSEEWPEEWVELENQVLDIVNEVRASGANCGSKKFAPAPAVTANSVLRCVARVHSQDMVERDFFDHQNPDGASPFDRMSEAGYAFRTAGENIAAGSATAERTMQQWMESEGHCRNIMNPDFKELGVGYYPGGQWRHMWTQVFGTPR